VRRQQGRAGRPRDADLDERLLEAAQQVFLDRGYQRASLSEVARRAGVGTPALYRRWRTKTEMAIDVVERASRPDPIPDTGTIRADLAEFVKLRLRTFSTRLFHHVLLPVVLEASGDPELSSEIRRRFVEYRQPWMQARIGKAIAAGELRRDTDPDRLIDLLMGPVVMPLIFSQDLPAESEAAAIVENLLDGFAAR
jgi:AcrR family transcriptional regulator